jgi:hypothetical protein
MDAREGWSQPARGSVPLSRRFSRTSSLQGLIPSKAFVPASAILSLTRIYNNARVDAACRRGIQIKVRSVASIRSILKNGLDRTFLDETSGDQPLRQANIRGQGYFHWTMEVSMLTHPTHERLITLGLAGMAKALEEQRQSPDLDALSF